MKHKKIENFSDFVDVMSIKTEGGTPEDTFRESECAEAIKESVNRLPARCREIFLMKKEDGLTYSEISEILDISVKTVETQMGRAFRALRKDLVEYM
jgi:RNA polymerase sigma-70 factor, ECF subfamily